jgi:uncharacterized protein
MIRAVIDTNILIRSVLNPKGPTGLILEELRAGRFRLIYSEPLLEELAGVLARPRFRNKYKVSGDDVSDILSLIVQEGEEVSPSAPIEACRDPKDNKVLEAAVFGQADVIVTGDEDLFALDPFEGIRILGLPDFLTRLRAG